MRKKSVKISLQSIVIAILWLAITLWFSVGYPHLLNYHEQFQLFEWTTDYFVQDLMNAPGGFACWLSEFIVQFYYLPWLGAMLIATVLCAIAYLVATSLKLYRPLFVKPLRLLLQLIVILAVTVLCVLLMGDYNLLFVPFVATLCALLVGRLARRAHALLDIIIVPILFWLLGPGVWVYVLYRIVSRFHWTRLLLLAYVFIITWLCGTYVTKHWSMEQNFKGIHFYRNPSPYEHRLFGYHKDVLELIRYDYLVRYERWDEIIERAEKYQPKAPFSSVCVNLALAKTGQLSERLLDFYQSGRDGLLMPAIMDCTSDLPSSEVFWHLGMVNDALRYSFDMQEGVLNWKKSARLTKRLAECYVINGHKSYARKNNALLKNTLFYSGLANELERMINNDQLVNEHPVYGKQRRNRYKEDYFYYYGDIDKMWGRLFVNNPENTMALEYFMCQMLLNQNYQGMVQHMNWVQQYGGFEDMPRAYRTAPEYAQKQFMKMQQQQAEAAQKTDGQTGATQKTDGQTGATQRSLN